MHPNSRTATPLPALYPIWYSTGYYIVQIGGPTRNSAQRNSFPLGLAVSHTPLPRVGPHLLPAEASPGVVLPEERHVGRVHQHVKGAVPAGHTNKTYLL